MAEVFRMPKSVVLELRNQSQDIQDLCKSGVENLSLSAVGLMAESWSGVEGRDWASKIKDRVISLAESLTEENRVAEIVVDETSPEPVLFGVDNDFIADAVMATDAAMDAAQTLLEGYEDKDATVAQAYYLLCAADAALSIVIESLGLVDADDEMNEMEVVDSLDMARDADIDLESRKSAMASAERVTMDCEVRALSTDSTSLRIGGYAAQFNKEATGLSFREVIAPGAFTRTLQSDEPVFLLVNHDTDSLPLASTASGTMTLRQDETGLLMEADLDPNNPRAQELASAVSRGDVSKMSFAFTVAPDGDTREAGIRTLHDLNLYEVSVVTWPAYDATTVGMRTASAEDAELEALELRKRMLELKQKFSNSKNR